MTWFTLIFDHTQPLHKDVSNNIIQDFSLSHTQVPHLDSSLTPTVSPCTSLAVSRSLPASASLSYPGRQFEEKTPLSTWSVPPRQERGSREVKLRKRNHGDERTRPSKRHNKNERGCPRDFGANGGRTSDRDRVVGRRTGTVVPF